MAYGADRLVSGAKPWFHYWREKELAGRILMSNHEPNTDPSIPTFRLFRPNNPVVALGFATKYLFTKPAFANLSFAACTNALVNQIERGHYWLLVDSSNDVQGFIGWGLTTEEKAESWLQGAPAPSGEENKVGDCIVFSAYAADSSSAHRYLWDRMREIMKGKRIAYFKRQYKDGRLRPGRLIINAFVSNHIERNASGSAPVQE